jgi:O-antigen ligase
MSIITPDKLQIGCFFTAIILYSLWGGPTPDTIGLAEGIIALLLLLSVRLETIGQNKIIAVLLLLMILTPTLVAFLHGNTDTIFFRDIIALGFFFLPLFYMRTIENMKTMFFPLLAWVGCAFSLRALVPYAPLLMTPALWGAGPPADLLYLANSPEVLFAGLYGIYLIMGACSSSPQFGGRFFSGIAGLLVCVVTSLAMAMMLQRAGLALMVGYAAIGIAALLYKQPLRGITLALLILAIFGFSQTVFDVVGQNLWQKTTQVGLNGRLAEWQTVLNLLSSSPLTVVFGFGWGYQFENPAVGGLPVGYTHSLLSFLLLKTGLCGLVAAGAGIFGLVTGFSVWRRGVPAYFLLTLVFPLLIAVLLYASYKSIGFGLILCGIYSVFHQAGDDRIRKLEKNTPAMA